VDSSSVIEKSATASLKEVEFVKTGCVFLAADDSLLKGMADITTHRSSSLLDKDCDGVIYTQPATETNKTYLIDLKSRFSLDGVTMALTQLVHSLFKLHAMQSLCEGYDGKRQPVELIVACQCFEDEQQESAVLLKLSQNAPQNAFYKVLSRLVLNGQTQVRLGDLFMAQIEGLTSDLKNKKITLTLITTEKYGDNKAVYRI
jgi:hypothetical protein